MKRERCTCAPHHRPPCPWCVQRMARSEAVADRLLAQLAQDFPGDEEANNETQEEDESA
jgi:hypothetical protein